MNILLPKVKRTKALAINPKILLLYSSPKVGKTTLAAELENNLVLDIESGSDHVETGLIMKVNDLNHLYEIGEQIKEEGRPYKYITLDTASMLEQWTEEYATNELYRKSTVGKNFKGNSVLELANGGGYFWTRTAFAKWFSYLEDLAPYFILLCHVRDKLIVDKNGREVESSDVDLTGKLKSITCSKAAAIGYLYKTVVASEAGKPVYERRVNFGVAATDVSAACRPKHLDGQDFKFDWSRIYIEE